MSIPWQRYSDEPARAVDTMTAASLFAAFLLGSEIRGPGTHRPDAGGPAVALAALFCGALFRQRTHPRTVVTVTVLGAAGAGSLGRLLTPLLPAPVIVALFRPAVATGRGTTRMFFLATLAPVVTTAFAADPSDHPWPLKTLGPGAWLLLPVARGDAVRMCGVHLDAVRARAGYAERSREEARHRVAEEHIRIAREVHDAVAHHPALANAQPGTAAHLARTHPEQVRRILTDLAGTTSSALSETKATVGVLRQQDDPDAPLAPSPRLGRLDQLADASKSTGLTVPMTTEGAPRPLTPGLDLAAYGVVQEAPTNVAEHTAAPAAHVHLYYGDDQLTLTVTDDGTSTAAAAPAPVPHGSLTPHLAP
ncbi:histidine kinase [Streptomyces coacervatus]|uniref:histidine kinase n=1 Tax=Streptomyces coacervatus TaxID=647381 RepID=A0ABP7GPI0_9ACTN|nr:histidine kinase [Streptomyces coacervatus]MDF2264608.1 histidine kinase [Streptomyces coacervatus]